MCIIFLSRAQTEWEKEGKLTTAHHGKQYDRVKQIAEGDII